jgi:hypothetical protein
MIANHKNNTQGIFGNMHDLRHVPSYYTNRKASGQDEARLQEMADQFLRVMMDSGFSPKDVATAFLRSGMKLAQQIPASTPEPHLKQLLLNAASATSALSSPAAHEPIKQ